MGPLNIGLILILCCIALVYTKNVPIDKSTDETSRLAFGCSKLTCPNKYFRNNIAKNNAKVAIDAATLTSVEEDTLLDKNNVRAKRDQDCRSNRAQCPVPPK